MFNILWFKPDGGKERYFEYTATIAPLLKEYGARLVDIYAPIETFFGNISADMYGIVEWSSLEKFKAFLSDERYKEVEYVREEALANFVLVALSRLPLSET